jgi:hypothetical protein
LKISIHQPNYLPYPGFFAKVLASDVFVVYDTAKFTRGDYINRNKIRSFSEAKFLWLTLPVGKKDFSKTPISRVLVTDEKVFSRHSRIIRTNYLKAPFFDEDVCRMVSVSHASIADHNIFLINSLITKLKINVKVVLASQLGIPIRAGTEGLIDIVKALQGNEYVSGIGAKDYLKPELFKKESIALTFINYSPLRYNQIHPGFVENMSIIDAAFNVGWENLIERLNFCVSKNLKSGALVL